MTNRPGLPGAPLGFAQVAQEAKDNTLKHCRRTTVKIEHLLLYQNQVKEFARQNWPSLSRAPTTAFTVMPLGFRLRPGIDSNSASTSYHRLPFSHALMVILFAMTVNPAE
jgi:hypothetical protein